MTIFSSSPFPEVSLPYSKTQINKIGDAFLKDPDNDHSINEMNKLMLNYTEIAGVLKAFIESELEKFPKTLESLSVTERVKTRDTLFSKMEKTKLTLTNVQDVLGLRVEADITTTLQLELAEFLKSAFLPHSSEIKNYLDGSGHSGYRAIHLWLNVGVKVEIQIRTILQGKWANLYEVAADVIGREIRYDKLPENPTEREVVEALQELSLGNVTRVEHFEENILSNKQRVTELELREGWVVSPRKFKTQLSKLSKDIAQEELILIDVKSQMLVHFSELESMFFKIRDGR